VIVSPEDGWGFTYSLAPILMGIKPFAAGEFDVLFRNHDLSG